MDDGYLYLLTTAPLGASMTPRLERVRLAGGPFELVASGHPMLQVAFDVDHVYTGIGNALVKIAK